jgi:hypothetical protein
MSSSRWRDSDSISFASANTDPLSSPTDGYFSHYGTLPDTMFIDTQSANLKSGRPAVVVSDAESESSRTYEQDATPLLESFVGQEAPPPSYLEATTPMPWEGRPSGDEESRLLVSGRASFSPMTPGREDMGHRDGKYRKRSFGDQFSRKNMFRWVAATLGIIILAAVIMAVAMRDIKVCGSLRVACIALLCKFECSHARRSRTPSSLYLRNLLNPARLRKEKTTSPYDGPRDAAKTTMWKAKSATLAPSPNST